MPPKTGTDTKTKPKGKDGNNSNSVNRKSNNDSNSENTIQNKKAQKITTPQQPFEIDLDVGTVEHWINLKYSPKEIASGISIKQIYKDSLGIQKYRLFNLCTLLESYPLETIKNFEKFFLNTSEVKLIAVKYIYSLMMSFNNPSKWDSGTLSLFTAPSVKNLPSSEFKVDNPNRKNINLKETNPNPDQNEISNYMVKGLKINIDKQKLKQDATDVTAEQTVANSISPNTQIGTVSQQDNQSKGSNKKPLTQNSQSKQMKSDIGASNQVLNQIIIDDEKTEDNVNKMDDNEEAIVELRSQDSNVKKGPTHQQSRSQEKNSNAIDLSKSFSSQSSDQNGSQGNDKKAQNSLSSSGAFNKNCPDNFQSSQHQHPGPQLDQRQKDVNHFTTKQELNSLLNKMRSVYGTPILQNPRNLPLSSNKMSQQRLTMDLDDMLNDGEQEPDYNLAPNQQQYYKLQNQQQNDQAMKNSQVQNLNQRGRKDKRKKKSTQLTEDEMQAVFNKKVNERKLGSLPYNLINKPILDTNIYNCFQIPLTDAQAYERNKQSQLEKIKKDQEAVNEKKKNKNQDKNQVPILKPALKQMVNVKVKQVVRKPSNFQKAKAIEEEKQDAKQEALVEQENALAQGEVDSNKKVPEVKQIKKLVLLRKSALLSVHAQNYNYLRHNYVKVPIPGFFPYEKPFVQQMIFSALQAHEEIVNMVQNIQFYYTGSPYYERGYYRLTMAPIKKLANPKSFLFRNYQARTRYDTFNQDVIFKNSIRNNDFHYSYMDELMNLCNMLMDGIMYIERRTFAMMIVALMRSDGYTIINPYFMNPIYFPLTQMVSTLVFDRKYKNFKMCCVYDSSKHYDMVDVDIEHYKNFQEIYKANQEDFDLMFAAPKASLVFEFIYTVSGDVIQRSKFTVVRRDLNGKFFCQHSTKLPYTLPVRCGPKDARTIAKTLVREMTNVSHLSWRERKYVALKIFWVKRSLPQELKMKDGYADLSYRMRSFFVRFFSMYSLADFPRAIIDLNGGFENMQIIIDKTTNGYASPLSNSDDELEEKQVNKRKINFLQGHVEDEQHAKYIRKFTNDLIDIYQNQDDGETIFLDCISKAIRCVSQIHEKLSIDSTYQFTQKEQLQLAVYQNFIDECHKQLKDINEILSNHFAYMQPRSIITFNSLEDCKRATIHFHQKFGFLQIEDVELEYQLPYDLILLMRETCRKVPEKFIKQFLEDRQYSIIRLRVDSLTYDQFMKDARIQLGFNKRNTKRSKRNFYDKENAQYFDNTLLDTCANMDAMDWNEIDLLNMKEDWSVHDNLSKRNSSCYSGEGSSYSRHSQYMCTCENKYCEGDCAEEQSLYLPKKRKRSQVDRSYSLPPEYDNTDPRTSLYFDPNQQFYFKSPKQNQPYVNSPQLHFYNQSISQPSDPRFFQQLQLSEQPLYWNQYSQYSSNIFSNLNHYQPQIQQARISSSSFHQSQPSQTSKTTKRNVSQKKKKKNIKQQNVSQETDSILNNGPSSEEDYIDTSSKQIVVPDQKKKAHFKETIPSSTIPNSAFNQRIVHTKLNNDPRRKP